MTSKRIITIILTLSTILLVFAIFAAVTISPQTGSIGYDKGYSQTMAGTGAVVAEGIDVSEHQSGMNLQTIKDAGFDYVIIRAGVRLNSGSNRKDYNFEDFYEQARAVGLDVGAYYYSQAKTVDEAKEEAQCFLTYIKGKKFEYPVYMDFESSSVKTALESDPEKAAEICYAFMDTMAEAGYLVGLYSYASWFDDEYSSNWMASKLNNDIGKKYEFWMANYYDNTPTNIKSKNYPTKYGMYQYTSSKKISGWSRILCANVCYKDYPTIVEQYGFNGYGSTENEIETNTQKATQKKPKPQKETLHESNDFFIENESDTNDRYIATDDYYNGGYVSNPTYGGERVTEVDRVNETTLFGDTVRKTETERKKDDESSESGCASVIGVGVAIVAVTGIGGAIIVIKRKRED